MGLPDQMMRAARLDVTLYEDVERDTTQTTNAMIVVALAALASGISTAIGISNNPDAAMAGGGAVSGLVAGLLAALLGWAISAGCIYFVGTRLFSGTATWGEVLRTVGFANSPGVLAIFGFVPLIGGLIGFAVAIWTLIATVIAIRQALDVGTGRAILAGLLGGLLAAVIAAVILAAFGVSAMMFTGMAP